MTVKCTCRHVCLLNTLQKQYSETYKEVNKKAREDNKWYVEEIVDEAEKVVSRCETSMVLQNYMTKMAWY